MKRTGTDASTIAMIAIVLVLVLSFGTAASQNLVRDADLQMYPDDAQYDSAIPTPESVLAHELGAAPVRHHKLVDYITSVAGLSDRMSLQVIGYSHERRPILFLVVTSPANHARLQELKDRHIALSEPHMNQLVTSDMPVVTWLNYGVHGAESSGMDAALPTIYHLAAARGVEIDRVLQHSIILVTAIFNPDGHAKRTAWFDAYSSQVVNPDPQHIEHDFDWQFARTNHYWFDLNRQWLPVTQPESRAWMRKWHEWRPNLTVDYHEMNSGSTYYFHPGIESRTSPLVTEEGRRLMAAVVGTSESFLDSEARLYFHGESFDNFYIGKGSTFPYVNGGVGILYEAAAALGVELETPNGLRSYRENIRKHFRTSLASIEGALKLREELLAYQKGFYESALAEARRASIGGWVFAAPGDPARMHHFLDLLRYHRIKAYRLAREVVEGGTTYRAGEAAVVPVNQPQYRLIRGIFETVSEFKDTTFYDVSAWTLPLAFGLQHAGLSGRRFNTNLLGNEVVAELARVDAPAPADYAYVFDWSQYYAPRALRRILEEDLLARVATRPFSVRTTRGTVAFEHGAVVVPFDRQEKSRDEIAAVMRAVSSDDQVFVHSIDSGASMTGTSGVNVGGPSFKPLSEPHILLVTGRDINRYEAGEAWHLLDFRMRTPVTLRGRNRLDGIDWTRYTHVVFPGGDYGKEEKPYLPDYLPRLRQWVNEGGTVIGLREASLWLRTNVLDFVEPLPGTETVPGIGPTATIPDGGSGHDAYLPASVGDPERFPYHEKETQDALRVIGGAIFSGDLDVSHPLGLGYAARGIALHKEMHDVMTRTANPYGTVIAYATPPVLSGFASDENKMALEGTAALIAERKGEGSIILFADNPNFRGYWFGTNKLFLNALYFSKAFDPLPEH